MAIMTDELQKRIWNVYKSVFGRTPLTQRLDDIRGEVTELTRYTDMANLREETGDLLSSVLQLCNECGWDASVLIDENLAKIERRKAQYHGLGRKLKIAVLGGAFDPITTGHIQVARFVLNISKTFDEVWLLPCAHHLYNKKMESADHRLQMCDLASKVDGRIKVCDFEIRHKLRGETYHMVKKFLDTDLGKNKVDISLVIGLDNANTFDNWINYRELERMVRFVVIPRTGEKPKRGVDWYLKPPHLFLQPDEPLIEMSSTKMRQALAHYWKCGIDNPSLQKVLNEGLDPKVLKYIVRHGLYRPK